MVIPLVLLVDAVLAPRRRPLPWRTIGVVVVFPILWALYTMIRANLVTGPATGDPWWYPYPFLDPHLVAGGYLGVAGVHRRHRGRDHRGGRGRGADRPTALPWRRLGTHGAIWGHRPFGAF